MFIDSDPRAEPCNNACRQTFAAPGTYNVFCEPHHTTMHQTVTVRL